MAGAPIKIGTRGSALALAQAHMVADALAHSGSPAPEIVVVKTPGDSPDGGRSGLRKDGSAPREDGERAVTDKARWVVGLELALLSGEIDLAVHSAKDVPGELSEGLVLLGSPGRAPAEDVLVGVGSLEELPENARVGTSSLRRAAQLRAARPDLEIVSMRGNVDTRLRKLAQQDEDSSSQPIHAIVLASAGLHRLGRASSIGGVLDPERFVPAPGQGALALQARSEDQSVREAVAPILDRDAFACLQAERAVASALAADCDTPFGAHAVPAGCGCLLLRAWVGLPDGSEWTRDELLGGFYDAEELGRRVAERLEAVGARELLRGAHEMVLGRTGS